MKTMVATIAARNYLASVLLLAESTLSVHPEAQFSVLVTDALECDLEGLRKRFPDFTWIGADALGIEPSLLSRMAFYYGITEFATALKPWLLRHLLREAEVVIFLDPDIEVFGELGEMEGLARTHDIVLTPHVLNPVPRDTSAIAEENFLLSGQFNLGFIAVSRAAHRFLDYWSERLERHCLIRVEAGYFTDQRWVDAVPSLFEHVVVRNAGWNVAYWNLHERDLVDTGAPGPSGRGSFLVNGEALCFFHYSGHRATEALVATAHNPTLPIDIAGDHALRKIFIERSRRILAMELPVEPYRWGYFPDGRVISPALRVAYWMEVDHASSRGKALPPSPFDQEGSKASDEWWSERIDFDLPRIALAWARYQPDVAASFGTINHDNVRWLPRALLDDESFLAVARQQDLDVLRSMLPSVSRSKPGINLIGYLRGEFGLGSHARSLGAGVLTAGIPLGLVALSAPNISREAPALPGREALAYKVNMVCVNADALRSLENDGLWGQIEAKPTVGVWNWELGSMPGSMVRISGLLDEIWCGSHFAADAIRSSGAQCEVLVHPLCLEVPRATRLVRSDLGLDEDRFLFSFSFDFGSVAKRKNHIGLIRAYRKAFSDDGSTGLVLKVMRATPKHIKELQEAIGNRSDITVVTGHWSEAQMRAFYQLSDCYVSLHRSEGIGLTMASAMLAGTPVIATGWSGNMSFMDEATAVLVPYEMRPVGEGCDPYPADSLWAEPNEEFAVLSMQGLAHDPEAAKKLGERGRDHLRSIASPEIAASWIMNRYETLATAKGSRRSRVKATT